jgi:hypothetical protein
VTVAWTPDVSPNRGRRREDDCSWLLPYYAVEASEACSGTRTDANPKKRQRVVAVTPTLPGQQGFLADPTDRALVALISC